MKMLLIEKELWGIADGTDDFAADAMAVQRTAYEKKTRKALATVCVLIDDSQAR